VRIYVHKYALIYIYVNKNALIVPYVSISWPEYGQ